MESKKINQLATELTPDLSDLTIIGDPTTGVSKKITLSQMASLFTGTVEEYANLAAFPLVGVADTIYVAKDTNVIYRWDTSAYVVLSPNIIASLVFNDANGFDGTIALVGSVATLTITTALTTGSVPFIGASGALLQDNSNLFFDDTNNRLGLGTNAPTTTLDVFGSGIIGRLNGTSTNNAFLGFASAGTNRWSIGNVQSDHRFRIYNEATTSELVSILSTGEFGIGIANPTTKFHIDGAASALIANLDANVSVAKSISFRSDNSNRINIEVSGTESGLNAGANLFIRRYSDAGALLDTPLTITRSTGAISLATALSGTSATFSSSVTANNYFRASQSTIGGFFQGWDGTNEVDFGSWKSIIGSGNSYDAIILSSHASSGFFVMTGGSSTPKLTITSAGNVGIGTSSPTAISTYTTLEIRGATGGGIKIGKTSFAQFNIQHDGTDAYFNNTANGIMYFYTNDTERMRITSGGYTKISNTGTYEYPTGAVHEIRQSIADFILYGTNSNASSPNGHYIQYTAAAPNGTGNNFITCVDSSASRFRVASNGNCYNVTGNYTSGVSDIKYKEQVVDANSQWNDIKNLRVVNFKFIKDVEENGDNALRHIGFIAQEVEKTSPNLIEEMSDEKTGETWKTIKASIIHTKAIKALQESMARVETLESNIQNLQAQIEELKALIAAK